VPEGASQRRHCWVVLPDVEPLPGVVIGWERAAGGGWQARVACVLGDETGEVVTGWLPASVLRPHDAAPVTAGTAEPPETQGGQGGDAGTAGP